MRITRRELYHAIWKTPAMHLAKTYGISDVALAKICKKLSVPKPSRAHWQRKAAGRRVHRPPLPHADCPEFVEIKRRPRVDRQPKNESVASELRTPQIAFASTLEEVSTVIRRLRNFLHAHGVDRFGRLGVAKASPDLGDLSVTPAQLDRAILLLDGLVRLFAAVKHPVKITIRKEFKGPPVILTVAIQETIVRFQIVERVLHRATEGGGYFSRTEHIPTGKLQIQVRSEWFHERQRGWQDGTTKRVEDQLRDAVAGVLEVAEQRRIALETHREQQRREELERQHRALQEAERRRRAQEAERVRKLEENRRQQLDNAAEQWEKAKRIRAFLAMCECRTEGDRTPDRATVVWLEWAHKYANEIDPFEDSFLTRVVKSFSSERIS